MSAKALTRINFINIGLMLISALAALLMPLEVFLFSYAFFGPLHYLTEISWLHDRQYFTQSKYDYLPLVLISILISLSYFGHPIVNGAETILIAFMISAMLAYMKNIPLKVLGIVGAFALAEVVFLKQEPNSAVLFFLDTLLPTLIHVFLFTGFFILLGSLRSKSKSGYLSLVFYVLCPLFLFFCFQNQTFIETTNYGREAYFGHGEGFYNLNVALIERFFHVPFENNLDRYLYHSQYSLPVMRLIAFAYTYHYLNWFSKTEVIRWHQVPKARLWGIVGLWIASVALYLIDYSLGLLWLVLLSLGHVLLEFPLNWKSMVEIVKELRTDSTRKATP